MNSLSSNVYMRVAVSGHRITRARTAAAGSSLARVKAARPLGVRRRAVRQTY